MTPLKRETEDEANPDELARSRLARLACSEGEAYADGDIIRAAALRGERSALLKRLSKAQPTLSAGEKKPRQGS